MDNFVGRSNPRMGECFRSPNTKIFMHLIETPVCSPTETNQTLGPRPSNALKELTHHPYILSAFSKTLKESGFAGPTLIPELLFLALHTRVDEPVSVVIKGPSSSGKSHALKSMLKFIPSEAFELFHGMSEKALLYLGLDLKNKFLVIQEASGMSEGVGRVFLRQLLSEGSVRYATVGSTDRGPTGQELPPIQGPTGLVMTTTANGLHQEDETRLLSVRMDESPSRIRETLLTQADNSQSRDLHEDQITCWHEMHRLACKDAAPVTIPYAKLLAERLPVSHNRVARDFPQVLSLIRAHARLHRVKRNQDDQKRIVATIDDYSEVQRLVGDVLAQTLEVTVPPHIRQVVEAVQALSVAKATLAPHKDSCAPVSLRSVASYLNRDQGLISRNLRAAIEAGYLANLQPGQGREARLILGERSMPSGRVLPSRAELVEAMKGGTQVAPTLPAKAAQTTPTIRPAIPF
jgi:hypothetical protein